MRRIAMKHVVAGLAYACLTVLTVAFPLTATAAVDNETVRALAFGESDDKLKAIGALTASGNTDALALLQDLRDGDVQTVGEAQVLLVKDAAATDLLTGKRVTPVPESRDDIVINNRVRKGLETALAAFKLADPDRGIRLAAVKQLQDGADEALLPAIERALAKESDAEVKELLALTRASLLLMSKDKSARLAAIR